MARVKDHKLAIQAPFRQRIVESSTGLCYDFLHSLADV